MEKQLVVNIDDKTYTLVKTPNDIIVYEKRTDEYFSVVINHIGFDNFYESFRVMYYDDRRIVKELLKHLGVETYFYQHNHNVLIMNSDNYLKLLRTII